MFRDQVYRRIDDIEIKSVNVRLDQFHAAGLQWKHDAVERRRIYRRPARRSLGAGHRMLRTPGTLEYRPSHRAAYERLMQDNRGSGLRCAHSLRIRAQVVEKQIVRLNADVVQLMIGIVHACKGVTTIGANVDNAGIDLEVTDQMWQESVIGAMHGAIERQQMLGRKFDREVAIVPLIRLAQQDPGLPLQKLEAAG